MKRYVLIALSAFALSGLIATPALAAKSGGGNHSKAPKHSKGHHGHTGHVDVKVF